MALKLVFDINDRATPQAKKLQDQLNRLERQISKTDNTFLGFDRTLAKTVGGFIALDRAVAGTRAFIQQADNLSLLQSQLALVTKSTAELTKVQEDLFNLAQDTRQGFSETANLYTRLAQSTEQLNLSQSDLLRVTETVNKALIVGGATAQEASASILQLGQALGSGRLQGDELRSLSENARVLIKALADGLGVARGEIKQLGADGELTSERVIQAFLSQSDAVDSSFEKIKRTVGQSFTNIENSTVSLVGRFEETTGATKILADELKGLSDFIDGISSSDIRNLINALEFVGVSAVAVGTGIAGTTLAFKTYNVINALVGAQNVKTAFSFNAVGQSVKTTTIETKALSLAFRSVPFIAVASTIGILTASLISASDKTTLLKDNYEDMSNSLKGLTKNQLDYQKTLVDTELATKRLELANIKADVANKGFFESEEEQKRDRARLDEIRKDFVNLQKLSREIKSNIAAIETGAVATVKAKIEPSENINDFEEEFIKNSAKRRKEQIEEFARFQDELQNLGKTSTEIELEELQKRFEANQEFIDKSSALYQSYANEVKRLEKEITEDNKQQQQQRLIETGTYTDGVKGGFEEVGDSARTNFEVGRDAVKSFASNSTDAIVKFAETGKLSFSDFARSVINDIARIIIQQQVSGLFGSLIGALDFSGRPGGAGTYTNNELSLIPNEFYTGGYTGKGGKFDPAGIVHKDEFVFNKEQTNAIGVGNLEQIAQGNIPMMPVPVNSGGGSNVNVIINNNGNSQVQTRTEQDEQGNIDLIVDIVDERIAGKINQDTSEIGTSLANNFRLSRQ